MGNTDIDKWMNGDKDYHQGVALYLKHGKSSHLKRIFSIKQNDQLHEKLIYELGKLTTRPAAPPPPKPRPKAQRTTEKPTETTTRPPVRTTASHPEEVKRYSDPLFDRLDWEELPDELRKDRMKRIPLFKKAASLHNHLALNFSSMSKEQREEMAANLVMTMDEVSDLWAREDHYAETGKVPPSEAKLDEQKGDMTIAELVKRRRNLPTYISKAKAKLQDTKDANKRAELEQKIAHFELEIKDIDQKLQNSG